MTRTAATIAAHTQWRVCLAVAEDIARLASQSGQLVELLAHDAGLSMSPRINHVGGCFDDLPEGTVGTVVVNAPSVVRAQFLQHAEADEPTEFLSHLSLQDHLAGWFGLVET